MGSTLVVFYSLTGNSKRLAQLLSAQTGWPSGEVVETRSRNSSAFDYLRCALDSLLRRRPEVFYRGPEPSDFANVVIVAPIWFGQLAGPMRSFIANEKARLARVAVLTTMGSRGSSSAVAEFARLAGRDPILSEAVTAREVQDGSCARALEAFAKAVESVGTGTPVRPAELSPVA